MNQTAVAHATMNNSKSVLNQIVITNASDGTRTIISYAADGTHITRMDNKGAEETKKRRREWTKEEDDILRGSDWSKLVDRSSNACKCRLRRLLKPGPLISDGQEWTPGEDDEVKRGAEAIHGRSFAAIEKRKSYLLREKSPNLAQ